MSHDIARIIYKLAKEDATLYSDDLQSFFKQHHINARNKMIADLSDAVKKHISENISPLSMEMYLPGTIYQADKTANVKKKLDEISEEDKIYACPVANDPHSVWLITNKPARYIIKNAILPLKLRWILTQEDKIKVTWYHWVD